ncbi:MAG: hypothetical protein EPO60_09705 [Rugosibacter sp.]|nr:MAG: hypothetical protein EPO60_09705 [Rugosibacter sp.]
MKYTRNWLIALGLWYVFNAVLTWPSVFGPTLPKMYPGITLYEAEPVFRLLTEAWVIVGIQLAAIGVVALWGARNPAKYLAIIPVTIVTETVDGIWDIYSITYSHEALWMGVTTLVIHAIIILTGMVAWRKVQL